MIDKNYGEVNIEEDEDFDQDAKDAHDQAKEDEAMDERE